MPYLANSLSPPNSRRSRAPTQRSSRAASRQRGELMTHLSAMDTAADVERIRQALSPNDGLVAYGASHGSQYGRAYLELYGEHVKALVLDGVVDHSIVLPTFITRNTLVCSAAYCVPTGGRSGTTPLLPLPRKP